VHTIGARDGLVDCYGDWARLRETDTSGAVLVRPDRHVAWRSDRYTGSEEHRRLRDLAVAREADAGVALLTEHIERAPRELIAYAQKHDLDAGPAKAVPD
jgi:DNA-binding GntR family transcriptional regulator